MKSAKVNKQILELLIGISGQVEDVRCRAIDIDLRNADEEQFRTATNKGDLYKYE